MEIHRYDSGLLCSNMYVITEGGFAVVIDPSRDTSPADGLKVEHIILTHEHYDHISGVNAWKEKTGAPVLCSKACAESLPDPKKNLSRHFELLCELQTWVKLCELPPADVNYSCSADRTFEDALEFDWRGHRFDLFEMPGHSDGSIGILLDGVSFFSGDSLIKGYEIALRLPGGSRKKWEETGRRRLLEIPDGVTVYPGHFAPFTYSRASVDSQARL